MNTISCLKVLLCSTGIVLGALGCGGFRSMSDSEPVTQHITPLSPTVAAAPAASLSEGLTAHWKLDEESDTLAADASGLGHGADLVNGPIWDSGKIAGSLRFDGVNDYLDAGSHAFGLSGEMSTALWLKPALLPKSRTQVLIQRGQYVYPFMMRIESNKIRACIRTTGGTHYMISQTMLSVNHWYHAALTFKSGEAILYLNGQEESRVSVPGPMNVMAGQKTSIGANPLAQYPFAGHLDDIRIYNRVLTPTELNALVTDSQTPLVVTQNGITWTFDRAYEHGQFANGDPWVVGPATITSITNNYHVHGFTPVQGQDGSQINPGTDTRQGYDRSIVSYDPSLNVSHPNNQPISVTNPLVLGRNQSLVSTVSWLYSSPTNTEPGCPSFNGGTHTPRPVLRSAAVLTCLASAPPSGSFRPPYVGTDKSTRFNVNQLRPDLLSNLSTTGVVSIPDVAAMENNFKRVWLDHAHEYLGSYVHPSENIPVANGFGQYMSMMIGDALLMLNLNFNELKNTPSKNVLLIEMVQLGIDLAGIADNGGSWPSNGAHNMGRKAPILFAGLMLDDTHMKNIGQWSTVFHEDCDTFYVSQATIDITHSAQWNPDPRGGTPVPYEVSDLGLPEWGIRHSSEPHRDNKLWTAAYRAENGVGYPGFVLAMHIMGLKGLWNHDALFDYQDRWWEITGGVQPPSHRATAFTISMWNKYRTSYPPIWSR